MDLLKQTNILLVDDEINVAKALRRILADVEHYSVQIAISGKEAIKIIEDQPDIAIIISDQMMPEMTGVEFLIRAHNILPQAKRIMLTGHAGLDSSIAAINQGAIYRYLTKPWDNNRMLETVADAAREYWLVHENQRLNQVIAKQNTELKDWNKRLKERVMEQTAKIRATNEDLAVRNRDLKESFTATIKAFSSLIQMRNHKANSHSQNVAALTSALTKQLGLSEEEHYNYYSAALLHDIGKIGMSDRLLNVSQKTLDGNDLLDYQKHVIRGQLIVEVIPGFRQIGEVIRHHHERFDGQGFPDKLKSNEVPLGSRLIAAADLLEGQLRRFKGEEDCLEKSISSMQKYWNSILDPQLREPLEKCAYEVFDHLTIEPDAIIANLLPKQLKVGMRLTHDLFSSTGLLMLKDGTVLDERAIEAVNRCQQIDPFEKKISVIVPSDARFENAQ